MQKFLLFIILIFSSCATSIENGQKIKITTELNIPLETPNDGLGGPIISSGTYGPFYDNNSSSSAFYEEGRIETIVHWVITYGFQNRILAKIDNDEVLVGGGGYVSTIGYDGSYKPFGVLIGSYPSIGTNGIGLGWVAESQDHPLEKGPHSLFVYAIGMKLKTSNGTYLSAGYVQKYVKYICSAFSQSAQHPTAKIDCPQGYAICSGGAQILDSFNRNSYLTANYNDGYIRKGLYSTGGSWIVSSKDHLIASLSQIRAWAVLIHTLPGSDNSIPGFGDIRVRCFGLPLKDTDPEPGYGNSVFTNSAIGVSKIYGMTIDGVFNNLRSFCITGAGGISEYNGNGRMLKGFRLLDNYAVEVTDKYLSDFDSGMLSSQVITIQYDYNSDS